MTELVVEPRPARPLPPVPPPAVVPKAQGRARLWPAGTIRLAAGIAAAALAYHGQSVLRLHHQTPAEVAAATRWYALGIVIWIVAWLGTYRHRTCLLRPAADRT